MEESRDEITQLLRAWSGGNEGALDRLAPLIYDELHRRAHHYMAGERSGHSLQTTALVNEAFLRLVDARDIDWQDRAHFFAIAARQMRRILVDYARSRKSAKRGGEWNQVVFDEALEASPPPRVDFIALDAALSALKTIDERKSRVVELRFFAGLDVEETAKLLQVSVQTVKRDWRLAKAWLLKEMTAGREMPGR